jgi:hypothetical protein
VSAQTTTYLILAATVAIFVWDRLPVAVVAVGVAIALWATDVLDLEQRGRSSSSTGSTPLRRGS